MRVLSIVGVVVALFACGCDYIVAHAIEDELAARRRAAEAQREREAAEARAASARAIWEQGESLLTSARDAAHAGDCRTVGRIELEVRALPRIDDLEGGFYDTVFLRDVEIIPCLTALRVARDACQQAQAWVASSAGSAATDEERAKILETMPTCDATLPSAAPSATAPPPPLTYSDRAVCVAARDATFARLIAAPAARDRRVELERLPSCPASSDADRAHEQAWVWTKSAAIAAVYGTCDPALAFDQRVSELDRAHHDAVYLREPDIVRCLETAERAREDHERCVRERADRRRRAMAIADVRERGRALSALGECSDPAAAAP